MFLLMLFIGIIEGIQWTLLALMLIVNQSVAY